MMSPKDMGNLDEQAFERLSAYLDGELTPAERRRVEADLEANPALAQALEELRRLSTDLATAYPLAMAKTAASLPPPSRSKTIAGARRRSARRLRPIAAAGLAAAAALIIGFGVGSWRAVDTTGGIATGPVAQGSRLAAALETAHVGDAATAESGELRMLGTFLTAEGAPCREFEQLSEAGGSLTLGVACRSDSAAWRVAFVASNPQQEMADGQITPAAGPGLEALEQLLDRLGAGPMLSAQEERRLIDSGWRTSAQGRP